MHPSKQFSFKLYPNKCIYFLILLNYLKSHNYFYYFALFLSSLEVMEQTLQKNTKYSQIVHIYLFQTVNVN